MLCQFTFSNFRSYRDETTFDFQAAALPAILMSLKEGRLMIMDELDARLHPKLPRYVIRLFTNPEMNPNGAQLLFTSHDMSTMKNSIFRRDEIWFAALDFDDNSEVYSLSEPRKEKGDSINNTAAYESSIWKDDMGLTHISGICQAGRCDDEP